MAADELAIGRSDGGRKAWALKAGSAFAEAINKLLWFAARVGAPWLWWLPALLQA
jgi:hypothetical protein